MGGAREGVGGWGGRRGEAEGGVRWMGGRRGVNNNKGQALRLQQVPSDAVRISGVHTITPIYRHASCPQRLQLQIAGC